MSGESQTRTYIEQRLSFSIIEADTPAGVAQQPLVLLHGSPGSRYDWREVLAALGPGAQSYVPDRPGYGLSIPGSRNTESVAGNAAVLAEMIGELCPGGAILAGHSFAGGVAIQIALENPALVSGLVLISSIGTRSAILLSDKVMALPLIGGFVGFMTFRVMGRANPRAIARFATAAGPAPPPNDIVTGLRRTLRMKSAWKTYVKENRSMVRGAAEMEERLSDVSVPALVVWGDADRLIPRKAAVELAGAISAGRFEIIRDAGHTLLQERPEEIAALIGEFAWQA